MIFMMPLPGSSHTNHDRNNCDKRSKFDNLPMTIEAIILAGGKGTRLSSVVSDRPKPMAIVAGRPFVEWLVLQLRSQGVHHIVFCTGHLADQIKTHFGNGARWGLEISYSHEHAPLGTGGAARLAIDQTNSPNVLLLNGDSYCKFNLVELRQAAEIHSNACVMTVSKVPDASRFGSVVVAERGIVQSFIEKGATNGPGCINSGVYLISRSILMALPKNQPISLERDVFPTLINNGLVAQSSTGTFLDIGTPESYQIASSYLESEFKSLINMPGLASDAQRARAQTHLRETAKLMSQLAESDRTDLLGAAALMVDCFRAGRKILLCGNGGSAADCQHFATELTSCLTQDFKRPGLPAIALTTDTSFITAYANDFGFDGIFERQLRTLGAAGDVLIGISTSGNSRNVIAAVTAARQLGIKTIGLLGLGGVLTNMVDLAVVVPSNSTQIVQEITLAYEHILCDLTERILFL